MMMQRKENVKTEKRRPFEIYLLILGALILSGFGWLRLQQSVIYWEWFQPPMLSVSPLYLAVGGAVWGVVGLTAALALWFRWQWGPLFTRLAAIFFAVWYWVDRLVFTKFAPAGANFWFAFGVTLIGLFYTFAALMLPRQRRYFAYREQHRS